MDMLKILKEKQIASCLQISSHQAYNAANKI